jgi:hypothetical protein
LITFSVKSQDQKNKSLDDKVLSLVSSPIHTGRLFKEVFHSEPFPGDPQEWVIYPNDHFNKDVNPLKFKNLSSLKEKEKSLMNKNIKFKKEKTVMYIGDTSKIDNLTWKKTVSSSGETWLGKEKGSKSNPFVYYTWEYKDGRLTIHRIMGTNSF